MIWKVDRWNTIQTGLQILDFPAVHLIVLTFVLATKYSWQKQEKFPQQVSWLLENCSTQLCMICRRNHQHLGDDDLIIIKMKRIIDKILMKCLGRSPPLVHCFFDGKYNSVLERRLRPLKPPATNKPFGNVKKWYKSWNQTSSPLEDVNVVQAWSHLASRRSGRESGW